MMNSKPTPTDASGYINEILRDAAERSARASAERPKPRAWTPIVLIVSLPLLGFLTLLNLGSMRSAPPAFTVEQDEAASRFLIYLVARRAEAHLERTGQLPRSLAEIDPNEDRLEYRTDGSTYVISAWTERGVVMYRRGEDLEPFARAARGLGAGI